MRKYKTSWRPCVRTPTGEHIIYATRDRALRDAAMTANLGFRYHQHEKTRRTLWGVLTRSPRQPEAGNGE